MKNITYHKIYPVGMVKGDRTKVYVKNGSELTVKKGKDESRFVTFRVYKGYKSVNVDSLYKDLFFSEKEKSPKQPTLFSKGDLKQQNRRGVFVPSANSRPNIISITGCMLYGRHIGKKLSELTNAELKWYNENFQLKNNEVIEMNKELKKRGLL